MTSLGGSVGAEDVDEAGADVADGRPLAPDVRARALQRLRHLREGRGGVSNLEPKVKFTGKNSVAWRVRKIELN